tara:strand:- start:4702 stop:5175 length:474 start_codon:yes stop_codon:yes gene_type:complete
MIISPVFLKKMGYKFAREILSYDFLHPEEKLWRAVVVNGIEDCLIKKSDRKSSLIKCTSHDWIMNKDAFDTVCDFGKLDSYTMRSCYIVAIKNRVVQFSWKQIAWYKYDILYKKMLSSEKTKRKLLRGELNKMRPAVVTSSTETISTLFTEALSKIF